MPPQVPPNMALTASVKGASEETSFSWATRPKTARVPRRYTVAAPAVPRIVALPTLRAGSRTSPALTAADSTPR